VKIDGIDETQKDSLPSPHPDFAQHIRTMIDPVDKLIVCVASVIVDNGGPVTPPGINAPLKQVVSGVVEFGLIRYLQVGDRSS
jgi:hypothetical protein